jgi:hypothetical protein
MSFEGYDLKIGFNSWCFSIDMIEENKFIACSHDGIVSICDIKNKNF